MNVVEQAKVLARLAHIDDVRKFTNEPYTSHLENVANLTKKYQGTRNQIAAAWLHDVIEDTRFGYRDILDVCGVAVAEIVQNCTDAPGLRGRERRRAKLDFIRHLPCDDPAILVMLCDVADNSESCRIVAETHGKRAFETFGAGINLIWYYNEKKVELFARVRKNKRMLNERLIYQINNDIARTIAALGNHEKPTNLW